MAVANTVEANIVATFQDRFSGPAANAFQQFRQVAQTALDGFSSFNIGQNLQTQLAGVVAGINTVVPELITSLASLSALGAEVTLTAIDEISPVVSQASETLAQIDQREVQTLMTVNDQASFDALRIRTGLEALFSRPIIQIIEARTTGFPGRPRFESTARSPISRLSSQSQGLAQPSGPSSGAVSRETRFASSPAAVPRGGNITFNIQGGFQPDRQTARKFARMMDDERHRLEQRKGS